MKLKLTKKDKVMLIKIKEISWFLGLMCALYVFIFIFVKVLIPIVMNMIDMLLELYGIYLVNINNIYIHFFGLILFLIISWKLFRSISYFLVNTFQNLIKEFGESFKQMDIFKRRKPTKRGRS